MIVTDLDSVERALRAGEVVGLPTDTVYGVGVDPFHPGATDRLFAAKRRPRDVELPVLVADAAQARLVATGISDAVQQLMERFWPGALTIVLARVPDVAIDLGGNAVTVGVRCPDHDAVRELCRRVGPLATTSANLHGQPTATIAAEVEALLGPSGVVLDGGTCTGSPSTVVDCTTPEPTLLREGRIPWTLISRQ